MAEADTEAEADAKGVVVLDAQSGILDSYKRAAVLQRFALAAAPLRELFIPFLEVGVFLYVLTLLGRGVLNALAITDFVLESVYRDVFVVKLVLEFFRKMLRLDELGHLLELTFR